MLPTATASPTGSGVTSGADLGHHAGELVAGHERRAAGGHALDGVQVAVADTHVGDAHGDVVGPQVAPLRTRYGRSASSGPKAAYPLTDRMPADARSWSALQRNPAAGRA